MSERPLAFDRNHLLLSVETNFENFRGRSLTRQSKRRVLLQLIDNLQVVALADPLTREAVAVMVGEIREELKRAS